MLVWRYEQNHDQLEEGSLKVKETQDFNQEV